MNMKTKKLEKPYKVSWVKGVPITTRCLMKFPIRKLYVVEIPYDVIEEEDEMLMDMYHPRGGVGIVGFVDRKPYFFLVHGSVVCLY